MLHRLYRDNHGDLAQAALTMPLLILISLALVNLALFGISGMNASNAANYGARIGSVNQQNPSSAARQAALEKVNQMDIGDYSVSVSRTGNGRGSMLHVRVTYTIPNYFAGLAGLFGGSLPERFTNTAVSTFRQEGW